MPTMRAMASVPAADGTSDSPSRAEPVHREVLGGLAADSVLGDFRVLRKLPRDP